ncbi:MAG: FAD-dependent oxidoreductase [Microbacteriaceae bacterium]
MKNTLDRFTGSLTMYRLVLGALLAIVVVAFVLSLVGVLAYSPVELLASLAVAVAVTLATGWLFALIFRAKAHTESSLISGLILFMLFLPSAELSALLALALASTIASASKFFLAIRGRHIFNPAASGAVVVAFLQLGLAGWWIATLSLLPVVALGAFLILYRNRKLGLGLTFIGVAAAIIVVRLSLSGTDPLSALSTAFTSYPIVFFVGFMLSEPLTLPPRRWQQLLVATLVGVLFAVPFSIPPVYSSPELALVLGNLVAFMFGQRRGIALISIAKRQLTPTTWEFAFEPTRPVSFAPGQYMELTLPHGKTDSRGSRRYFSISSPPAVGSPITFAMTISDPPSSFKAAMLALVPGDRVRGTLVGGDFILPKALDTPLLLIAGGIGITPFASQLSAAHSAGVERNTQVIYSVRDSSELAYADRLEESLAHVTLIAPTPPTQLPTNWTYAGPGRLTRESLTALVPDIATRRVFVSGSPALINSVTPVVRAAGAKRVTTDSFSGYS